MGAPVSSDNTVVQEALSKLLRLAVEHRLSPTEENHHQLVLASMEVGRWEDYERDQAIYELAKLVADFSVRANRRGKRPKP